MQNIPMPIATPRLTLRPLQPGDGEMVLQYKKDSWDELMKWCIWVHLPHIDTRTVQDDEAFCAMKYNKFENAEDITVIVLDKDDGSMVDAGGLHGCDWDLRSFSLGFHVHAQKTGRGYGTEISRALTQYAFEALDANRVHAMHAGGNIGSQCVLEKTGFIKEGVLRKCHNLWDKGIGDEHHYGLLKGVFQSSFKITHG